MDTMTRRAFLKAAGAAAVCSAVGLPMITVKPNGGDIGTFEGVKFVEYGLSPAMMRARELQKEMNKRRMVALDGFYTAVIHPNNLT